ncbi:hypothetical protein Q8A73_006771 [Channa argus]|nr:hypothetical protein Q8A73_006771 [Channa argus]
MSSSETPLSTLRQGIRIAPPDGSITVEEVLQAVGEQVGHVNLLVASRMNKAVVVFLKVELNVNDLIESGVVIRDLFVQVSPLSAPSTRITRNTVAKRSVLNYYGDNGDVERDAQSMSVVQQETSVVTNAQGGSQLGATDVALKLRTTESVLEAARTNSQMTGEEDIDYDTDSRTQTLQSTSLRTSFREAGCTKVGHLLKMLRPSVDTLREAVEEVLAALPQSLGVFVEHSALPDRWNDDCKYSFPSLLIVPAVGEWQEGEVQLLSFKIPQLSTIQNAGKKVIYQICIKVLNLRSWTGLKESRRTGFLGQDDSLKGTWRCLYKLPIEKQTADLQWRVVHGAIATNTERGWTLAERISMSSVPRRRH